MPAYLYKVRDRNGKILQGQMDASDAQDLRKKLDESGYFIIEYTEKKSVKSFLQAELLPLGKRVSLEDLSLFSWQLFTMLNAGLTLTNALKIMENQIKNPFFKSVLSQIWHRVEEGLSFSQALHEHPKVFSVLYVQMINAGEVGGVMDEMLRRLAVFYEQQAQTKNKVKLAMSYPIFLFVASFLVIVFLVTFVLPRFQAIFKDLGISMPWPTLILLSLTEYIRAYWYLSFVLLTIFFLLGVVYLRTSAGRLIVDHWKLRLPIIGDLTTKIIAARFSNTLSILVSGGIPILTALDVVADTIDNAVVIKYFKKVIDKVGEGKSIAKPLEESKIFPEMVINMIRVGEETGALNEMLDKVAQFYQREVDYAIQTFTRLIEPCLIVVMTLIVGFILISIFLPLADLMQGLHL